MALYWNPKGNNYSYLVHWATIAHNQIIFSRFIVSFSQYLRENLVEFINFRAFLHLLRFSIFKIVPPYLDFAPLFLKFSLFAYSNCQLYSYYYSHYFHYLNFITSFSCRSTIINWLTIISFIFPLLSNADSFPRAIDGTSSKASAQGPRNFHYR